MDLAPLAQRSAELSRSLATLGQQCEHTDTHAGIVDIANETLRLSSTLWRLREAVDANKHKYTDAFSQDLAEISSELQLVCDEIAECCAEMQKTDTPGPVPWFFKKGRVSKLQKHLVALKTTLVVMRTVLHHSKDYYGLQNSSHGLAASDPHAVQEDRAILDSICAKNRHAIQEFHTFEQTHETSLSGPSDFSISSDFSPDPHGRSLSNTTSLDSPLIPHNHPAATAQASSTADTAPLELQRRFSKREARLSIHTSILSMTPRETTAGLRKRWLQAAKSVPETQMQTKTATSEHVGSLGTQNRLGTPSSRTSAHGGGSDEEYHDDDDKSKDSRGAAGHDQARHNRRRTPGSGRSLKRLSSPATNAVRRLMKKVSFRRPASRSRTPAGEEESEEGAV